MRPYIVFTTAVILVLSAVSSARAEENPPKGMLVFDREIHEFGKITEGDVVKHTFRFVNKGPGPVKLKEIRLSCGCTTAQTVLKEYAPGEEGELEIRLDTAGKRGFILKSIEVYMENAVKEKIELAMTAELVPPPHPKIENVLLITKDPKCKTCHLEAGVGFKGGFLYHRICVQCHGRRGAGASAMPFNVMKWQSGVDDEYIRKAIKHGMPETGMPAYVESVTPPLTDEQVESLIEYIRSLVKEK